MEYLNKTGLDFSAGQTLKASDLKTMNNSINNIIDIINNFLRGLYDLNVELNDFNTTFTLEQAIQRASRRSLGMKLRFLSTENDRNKKKYVEYSYTGTTLDDIDWRNTDNWTTSLDVVDGGIW